MTTNKKAAQAGTRTASNTANDSLHSTTSGHAPDPLQGWYGLAANVKPSRTDRTPKRAWKRGKRAGRGYGDSQLLIVLALVLVVGRWLEGWV